MNGDRVLTVKSHSNESQSQRLFFCDSSLSKHLYATLVKGSNYTLLSICNTHSMRLLASRESTDDYTALTM